MPWVDKLNNLYWNEIVGFGDLFASLYRLILYPIHNEMWGFVFVEAFFAFGLCLSIYEIFFNTKRGIVGWISYPAPNDIGLKNQYVMPFNPLRPLMFGAKGQHAYYHFDTKLAAGFFVPLAAIASHYLWFLFIFKYLFLFLMFASITYFLCFGNRALTLMLWFAALLNLCYIGDYSIGFPSLEANYTIQWFGLLSEKYWVVLNPYNYPLDINKYVYVFFLFFIYLCLVRYIFNAFYWRLTKHKPNKWFMQKVEVKKTTQADATEAKSGELQSDDNTIAEGEKNPFIGQFKTAYDPDADKKFMRDLQLLGFSKKMIGILKEAYAAKIIEKALEDISKLDGCNNPKAALLIRLDEIQGTTTS